MLVVPRIDDESTLRAAVVDLMGNVSQYYRAKECAVGTVFYGAVFSLYEVSIVRFTVAERSGHDVRFQLKHTPSLRLLPREHASVPQTPGIEALTRLGQIILEKITRHNIITKNAFRHRSARSNSRILSLPVEICMNIARHLSPKTLLGFATISASCADTAADLLVQPYFGPSPSNIQNRSLFLEHSWYRVLSLPRSPGIELDTSGSAIIGTKDQDLHFSTFFAMNEEGQVLTFTVACAPALSHLKISEMPDKEKPKDYHQMAVVFGVGSKWCESPYD
ncbi:hypothetical protein GYMLUDRAFT_35324 [Collybiopsis luxurians FD-317 M1]|nr:hypothetical protein GYMLUDRAFT_35324 [Collybiopsis luxurians FD-317 M1]